MKKRIIAVIVAALMLFAVLLAGCSVKEKAPSAQAQDVIGIIGAMDVEVNSPNEEANIKKTGTFLCLFFNLYCYTSLMQSIVISSN